MMRVRVKMEARQEESYERLVQLSSRSEPKVRTDQVCTDRAFELNITPSISRPLCTSIRPSTSAHAAYMRQLIPLDSDVLCAHVFLTAIEASRSWSAPENSPWSWSTTQSHKLVVLPTPPA